jgi:hypothetical protein
MRIHKTVNGGLRFANLPRCGIQSIRAGSLKNFEPHVTITDTEVVFDTEDGPVEFDVVYPPGRFCLTCGERLPDQGSTAAFEAENAAACREHVATHGSKAEVSDKWPHGYRHMPHGYALKARDTELNQKLIAATR